MPKVVSVFMAGGKGERFWPMSRQGQPKQLLPIISDRPLLADAISRVLPITGFEDVLVVSNRNLVAKVHEFIPELLVQNLLAEPVGRNTAPCLAFAAHVIKKRYGPETLMLVLSADQYVAPDEIYQETLRDALRVAEAGHLTTIGIKPTRPETSYGYLQLGSPCPDLGPHVYQVQRFTEKPNSELAEKMVAEGDYLWNGGMFAWRVDVFLDALAKYLPAVAKPFERLDSAIDTPDMETVLDLIFAEVPKVSVDYGVMEKAEGVLTVVAEGIRWDDIGSWLVYERIHPSDASGNVSQGNVIPIETQRSILVSNGGLLVTIGIDDLVVVRQDDVVLVSKKDRAEELRAVLSILRASKEHEGFV